MSSLSSLRSFIRSGVSPADVVAKHSAKCDSGQRTTSAEDRAFLAAIRSLTDLAKFDERDEELRSRRAGKRAQLGRGEELTRPNF